MKQVRRKGDERRDQITSAALAIVDEQGTGALSVASVAHRVGVAPSALYRHYPDKDAMIAAMFARLGEGIRANLERAVAEGEADAVESLAGLLGRHVEFILANRGFPFLIFSDLVQQHPVRRELMRANLDHFRGVVAQLLRVGQQQGRVRADLDPEAAAFAFFGLFVPPALHWHLSGGRTDLAGIVRRAWSVFHAGVRADSAPAPRPRTQRAAIATEERP